MVPELEEKLLRLEEKVDLLRESGAKDLGIIKDINSQLAVFDSLVEFYKLPGEITARYNKARIAYAKLFEDRRIYISTDRSIRINKVVQDVEHLVDMQDFISEYVSGQNSKVDRLTSNILETEVYVNNALTELETHRTGLSRRMKFWRFISMALALFMLVFTYKLFV